MTTVSKRLSSQSFWFSSFSISSWVIIRGLLPVEILGGLIPSGPGGQDGHPVIDLAVEQAGSGLHARS